MDQLHEPQTGEKRMSGLHVNFARQDGWSLRRHYCPTCQKSTRFFGWFQDWYGWELTCLSCGEVFYDEERAERPFMRGWRKLSIKRAWKLARKCKENGVPFIAASNREETNGSTTQHTNCQQ